MNSEEAVPYIWAECQPPSDQVLKMWYEVGNKLDKESTGEDQPGHGHQRLWEINFCRALFDIRFSARYRWNMDLRISLVLPKPVACRVAPLISTLLFVGSAVNLLTVAVFEIGIHPIRLLQCCHSCLCCHICSGKRCSCNAFEGRNLRFVWIFWDFGRGGCCKRCIVPFWTIIWKSLSHTHLKTSINFFAADASLFWFCGSAWK